MDLKTSLYDLHVQYHGKMVPFAGYLLPVQYEKGVIAEHMAVRTGCGLFDVSHMGEFFLKGEDALENLNLLLANDYSVMKDGQARYSPMCSEAGGVLDDLIVYKVKDGCYFIVVNAANREKDFQWMKEHLVGSVEIEDLSDRTGLLALQGPKAVGVLEKVASLKDIPGKYYTGNFNCTVHGMRCILSKTGYTGEDGVEIYMDSKDAPAFWELLMEAGKDDGIMACGLGARDTLRLEAGMPLYGHEMDETITPLEAGLGTFVKLGKRDFIGKEAIGESGPVKRKRVGMKVVGRGIVREQAPLFNGDTLVGFSTSGTHCPFLGYAAAMGIVDIPFSEPGTLLEAEVRGRRIAVEVTALPFYKRKKEDK